MVADNHMEIDMTKFTATFEGQIVGTRSSLHGYAFAVIVMNNIEAHRNFAYNYVPIKTDRANFDFYAQIAQQQPGVEVLPKGWRFTTSFDAKKIEEAKAQIEGGFEGFAARLRDRLIDGFEASVVKGHFNPQVFGWSKTLANAQKMASKIGSRQTFLAIVPVD